jgi:hypothetical protein
MDNEYQLGLCEQVLKECDLKDWRVVCERGVYYFLKKFPIFNSNEFEEDSMIRIKCRGDLWQLAYKRHTGRWETLPLEINGALLRVAGTFEECVSALQSKFQYLLTNS